MHALVVVLITAIDIYVYVIIAVAVMSWLIAFDVLNIRQPFVRQVWSTLNALTEPPLRPIRNVLPNLGGIDVSPVILLLLLMFLRQLIVDNLLRAFPGY